VRLRLVRRCIETRSIDRFAVWLDVLCGLGERLVRCAASCNVFTSSPTSSVGEAGVLLKVNVEDEQFDLIRVSIDGGVTLECWRDYGRTTAEVLMEATWVDDTRSFRIRAVAAELPFGVWEAFIAEARRWCPLAIGTSERTAVSTDT